MQVVVCLLVAIISVANAAECQDPLGLQNVTIPDHQIHASSWTPGKSDPWYGRLGNLSRKSWCSTTQDTNQFLQIDFGPKRQRFTAISSQGSHYSDVWVKTYSLSYSDNGSTWNVYTEAGQQKVFAGNVDRYSIVKHSLLEPFTGRFLRFHPKSWNGGICMRVEAFGCNEFHRALGIEDGTIPNENMKCRYYLSNEKPYYARLNHAIGVRMQATFFEFLEVRIGGSLKTVTAVATQGHGKRKEWVTQYKLSYSADGAEWFNYTEHAIVKIFDGNTDMHSVVKHVLRHDITAILIRFNIYTVYKYTGMRVEIYGGEVCMDAVGIENNHIPNSQISASSSARSGNEAEKGRLNGAAAWCGVSNLDFLQIDLGKVYKIQKLATQGRPDKAEWTTKFAFHYSLDNMYWFLYEPEEGVKELNGNVNQNTIVYTELKRVRQARYVRFQPKTWNTGACMRVELYGCQDCMDALGFEVGHIQDSSMSATSWYDIDHEPWLGRLYETRGEMAWCAKTNDGNQFLQVDLGHVTRVTGVATQGKYIGSWWAIKEPAWVTAYKISYSNHTYSWTFYKDDVSNDKVFTGNSASRDIMKHNLNQEIVTRHVRFIPSTWETWTCMRLEVYGCKALDNPLGMEFFHIRKEAIVESTGKDLRNSPYSHMPRSARLNQDKYYGWSPSVMFENPHLQIDLGSERVLVTAVATQGAIQSRYNVVYKYTLSLSNNQLNWFDYREMWETKVLEASKSSFHSTKNYLQYPVTTRYIRFFPKQTVMNTYLRVEIYGVRGRSKSLLTSDKVEAFTVTNTSSVAWTKRTKLNDIIPTNIWCGKDGKFLRLDFGSVKEIRTIFIQGHPTEKKWIKTFSLRYSNDGIFYTNYTSYYDTKEFTANFERLNISKFDIDPRLAARYLEIHPVTWNIAPCMRIELYGDDDCSQPLGMADHRILDKDIKATSWITIDQSSSQARLHNTYAEGAWCPKTSDMNQYLEINLNWHHRITRIATQGRFPLPDCLAGDYWVTQYSLEYSINAYTWQYYQENNIKKVFAGNQDFFNVAVNHLKDPIIAKVVRIRPLQWNLGICMRMELYGCEASLLPIGMEDYRIPDKNIKPKHLKNKLYRLNLPYMPRQLLSDCLDTDAGFLTLSLGYIPYKVTGLANQCRQSRASCVTKFSLSFSLHDGEWVNYVEDGEKKVFYDDDLDFNTAKMKYLKYEIKAKHVRIWILGHYNNPCLRVEVYGYRVDNSPLGLSTGAIPDSSITASSQNTGFEAVNALLESTSTKAWCAKTPIQNEYLKIDLGRVVMVSQVAVGRLADGKGRVFQFWMSFSLDGKLWEVYNEDQVGRKDFKLDQYDIVNTNEAAMFSLRFPFRARFVKIRPSLFSGQAPCLTVELYGKEDCQDELGLADWRISKTAMTASSSISNNYPPWMGRVGRNEIGGAWCARHSDGNQFLQVDLGSQHKITRVYIQGKEKATDLPNVPQAWVKTFSLSSSKDGYNWTDAKDNSAVKVFEGNSNNYEVKKVNVSVKVSGRFIRVHPKTWHNHICMRVELVGCEECGMPLGMENWKINNRAIQTSSYHWPFNTWKARLNYLTPPNSFCTHVNSPGQFLQIDVGPASKIVSGVALQGRGHFGQVGFLTKFSLAYSKDGVDHVPFLENGKKKAFKGNVDILDTVKYQLDYSIVVRSVRIVVEDFKLLACMRAELYGCNGCDKAYGHHLLTGYSLSASSKLAGHTVDKAHLSVLDSAWCATTSDSSPYLQATLTSVKVISQIVTMGHPVTGEYVKVYQLKYSDDGTTWIQYREDSLDENDSKQDITRGSAMMEAFVHELQFSLETKYLKILFANTAGKLCLKVALYGHEVCKASLGIEDHIIPDSSFAASSSLSVNHSPGYARINRHLGHGAWCSNVQSAGEYLQVDLNIPHKVNGLALQAKLKSVGSSDGQAWVKGFTLKYSQDGSQWFDYTVGGSIKSFTGITNKQETAEYDLNPTLVGRFVRMVVSSWQNMICLRMELYGCKACGEPLGIESYKIPDNNFTGSSRFAYKGRLSPNLLREYETYVDKPLKYWQVDLGSPKQVTGVATTGRKDRPTSKLEAYIVECSLDGSTWTTYQENSNPKMFSGAKRGHILRYYFTKMMTCQHVRLVIKNWYGKIQLKAELYGCNP